MKVGDRALITDGSHKGLKGELVYSTEYPNNFHQGGPVVTWWAVKLDGWDFPVLVREDMVNAGHGAIDVPEGD
jgi:hypothetical protein